MSEPDIRLEHVTKRFHDVVAVDDVSLQIERGEFFSLLGPSGCGKTTSLRMIAGFEEPSSGTIYVADRDVSRLPPYRRDVNTVFQNYALFPHLSVFENVAFGLRRRRVGRDEIRTRVGDMLALVQLQGYEQRRPHKLSGGQQQRVALARALVVRPRVLLLDEPLGALDLKLRKQMQIELKRIQTEIGITFVHVTHDQDEAMTMSDRIAVMHAGRVLQLGRPAELYERPQSEFVAGFLGVSNLLEGRTHPDGDPAYASIALPDGTLIRVPSQALPGSGVVRVGVRPEKIRLAPVDSAPMGLGLNVLEGQIVDSSYVGVSTQHLVRVRGGGDLIVYAQNFETSGAEAQQARGQPVRLTWRPEHTFVIAGAGSEVESGAGAP